MIDVHCHFLPAIDDGAQTLGEALEMARAAVADGITHCVMTPHLHVGRYANDKWSILQAVQDFQDALFDHGIPLSVSPGAEVRMGVEALQLILSGRVPYLGVVGPWKVVLLELPHHDIPVGTLEAVDKLVRAGVRPLLAHPERNKKVLANPKVIEPLVAAGCWLQVTAGSLLGDFGRPSQTVACQLMDEELVFLVASDAHNLQARAPAMSRAAHYIEQRYGEAVCSAMVRENAARLLGGMIPRMEPQPC